MFLSRLTQMNVQINKTWRDNQTRRIKNFRVFGCIFVLSKPSGDFSLFYKRFLPLFCPSVGSLNDHCD
jgi:hypothetical protein